MVVLLRRADIVSGPIWGVVVVAYLLSKVGKANKVSRVGQVDLEVVHFSALTEVGVTVLLLLPAGGGEHVVRPLLPIGGGWCVGIVDFVTVPFCPLVVLTRRLLPVGGEGHLCKTGLLVAPVYTVVVVLAFSPSVVVMTVLL